MARLEAVALPASELKAALPALLVKVVFADQDWGPEREKAPKLTKLPEDWKGPVSEKVPTLTEVAPMPERVKLPEPLMVLLKLLVMALAEREEPPWRLSVPLLVRLLVMRVWLLERERIPVLVRGEEELMVISERNWSVPEVHLKREGEDVTREERMRVPPLKLTVPVL